VVWGYNISEAGRVVGTSVVVVVVVVAEAVKEYDIETHELPTFLFIEDGIEMDKLATGLSYQQLNGSGVTTENLANQIKIVFRI